MAIYHLSVKNISRRDGRSSVAAAAYRAGDRLYIEREATHHDYTRRSGVVHAEVVLPDGAPAWMADRERLWNAVENTEKRKDARLCKEVEIALPKELDHDGNIHLARQFSTQVLAAEGVAVDCAIHDDGNGNPHAHLLMPTRTLAPDGFGKKNRKLDDKAFLEGVRIRWQDFCNTALDRAGVDAQVDHRTLEAQGIDREPDQHRGPNQSIEAPQEPQERPDGATIVEATLDVHTAPSGLSGADYERVQQLHIIEQQLAAHITTQKRRRAMAQQYQHGVAKLEKTRAYMRRRQDQLRRVREVQDKAAQYATRQTDFLHKLTHSTYRQPDDAWSNLFRLFGMKPLPTFVRTVSKRPALFGELHGMQILFWKSPKRRAAHKNAARLPNAISEWQQTQHKTHELQAAVHDIEKDIAGQQTRHTQIHGRLLECPSPKYDADTDRDNRASLFQSRNELLDQLTPDHITASGIDQERQQQLIALWQQHELKKRTQKSKALHPAPTEQEDPFAWQRELDPDRGR